MPRLFPKMLILLTFHSCSFEQKERLNIVESHTLAIKEISGMCWRDNFKEILIINDEEDIIYVFDWENRNTKKSLKKVRVNNLEGSNGVYGGQWESINCGNSGKAFMLQEDPSRIVIVNSELTQILGEIELSDATDIKAELMWNNDSNSKGEGLIFAKNGNILISKEKKPFRLVEFSPLASSKEKGSERKLDKTLFAKRYWKFDNSASEKLKDVSSLSYGPDKTIYLLSDKSNAIAKVGKSLPSDSNIIKVKNIYGLPSDIKKAEALLFDPQGRPIVGIDSKKLNRPNLFMLEFPVNK